MKRSSMRPAAAPMPYTHHYKYQNELQYGFNGAQGSGAASVGDGSGWLQPTVAAPHIASAPGYVVSAADLYFNGAEQQAMYMPSELARLMVAPAADGQPPQLNAVGQPWINAQQPAVPPPTQTDISASSAMPSTKHVPGSVYIGADGREKRRRQPIACNRCRFRKVRCDGVRPSCGPCARHQVSSECTFPEKGRRRGSGRRGSSDQTSAAAPNTDPTPETDPVSNRDMFMMYHHPNARVEDAVAQADSEASVIAANVAGGHFQNVFTQPTPRALFAQARVPAAISKETRVPYVTTITEFIPSIPLASPCIAIPPFSEERSPSSVSAPGISPGVSASPVAFSVSTDLSERLISVYLEVFNPYFRFIHPERLLRHVRAGTIDQPLLHSIFALSMLRIDHLSGSREDRAGNQHISIEFAQLARRAVYDAGGFGRLSSSQGSDSAQPNASMATVQCLLNLVIWSWVTCRWSEAYLDLGMAIRIAYELRLQLLDEPEGPFHAQPSLPGAETPFSHSFELFGHNTIMGINMAETQMTTIANCSPATMEMRRRCWWACFQLDRLLCLSSVVLSPVRYLGDLHEPQTRLKPRAIAIDEDTMKVNFPVHDFIWMAGEADSTHMLSSSGSDVLFQAWDATSKQMLDIEGPLNVSWRGQLTELLSITGGFVRVFSRAMSIARSYRSSNASLSKRTMPGSLSEFGANASMDHVSAEMATICQALVRWREVAPTSINLDMFPAGELPRGHQGADVVLPDEAKSSVVVRALYWALWICIECAYQQFDLSEQSNATTPRPGAHDLQCAAKTIAAAVKPEDLACHPWLCFCLYAGATCELYMQPSSAFQETSSMENASCFDKLQFLVTEGCLVACKYGQLLRDHGNKCA